MENNELTKILAAKERRRADLARLPIEEKIRILVRLQHMAAPILHQRGKNVRCWPLADPQG